MTLEQTKMALVFSQLSDTIDETEREIIKALGQLVAEGQVDVCIDDSDGLVKFQLISED
jgi:phage gp36-like protein